MQGLSGQPGKGNGLHTVFKHAQCRAAHDLECRQDITQGCHQVGIVGSPSTDNDFALVQFLADCRANGLRGECQQGGLDVSRTDRGVGIGKVLLQPGQVE